MLSVIIFCGISIRIDLLFPELLVHNRVELVTFCNVSRRENR